MELRELAKTTAWWLATRDRVKEVIDGPDQDIDRIIQTVLDNGCRVPSALADEFPHLRDRPVAAAVENAVSSKSTRRGRL